MKYIEAIDLLPENIKFPILKAFEFLKEEIAETVKREDFERLSASFEDLRRATQEGFNLVWKSINELAEAQKKTEERLTRLERVVEELAVAQKRTEQELRELVQEHRKTRELLGHLSDTVGYGLEDKIMPYIPSFAMKEYGIKVSLVERKNVIYPDGKYDEVNIYVEGQKNGEKVYMIGECKAKPGKKDIDRFSSLIKRLSAHLKAPIYPFIVGYVYSPEVENYIKEKHPELKALKSFEFELKYSNLRP